MRAAQLKYCPTPPESRSRTHTHILISSPLHSNTHTHSLALSYPLVLLRYALYYFPVRAHYFPLLCIGAWTHNLNITHKMEAHSFPAIIFVIHIRFFFSVVFVVFHFLFCFLFLLLLWRYYCCCCCCDTPTRDRYFAGQCAYVSHYQVVMLCCLMLEVCKRPDK